MTASQCSSCTEMRSLFEKHALQIVHTETLKCMPATLNQFIGGSRRDLRFHLTPVIIPPRGYDLRSWDDLPAFWPKKEMMRLINANSPPRVRCSLPFSYVHER